MAVSGLTIGAVATPAVAAPNTITVDKTGPAQVLVGLPITFSVKASNPTDGEDDQQYNLTFRDVLPEGVSYVSTSAPTGAGDPQQIPERDGSNELTGRTILIWSNLADLPDGSDVTLTYTVKPDPDEFPVGSTVSNSATGYASNDERRVARFDGNGRFVTSPAQPSITSATDTADTAITALELNKSEPSSERELVRGVHDRTTVYSLEVVNNGNAATNDVVVVDYLPAGLEFLGCGGVDNSAPGTEEYPGAGRLAGTPAVGADCLTPTSVTTVNSNLPAGYPAGVYTRIEWSVPTDLAASQTYTIRYAAGIPLKANAMPSGGGFISVANLDNNTGASTRETATEISYTNRALVSGVYTGLNNLGQSNTPVAAKDEVTVTSEDIAVAKSVTDASGFVQGGEAEFNLRVRTSEYTDGSDIVLVDTLPDGLCPADAPLSAYSSAARAVAVGQCAPAGNNPAIDTVDYIDGVFVITFKAFDLSAADARTTVSYKARMRSVYGNGDETSAGDTFVNTVSLTGRTTPAGSTGETGTVDVRDGSSATLTSTTPALDKRVLPNMVASQTCTNPVWDDWKNSQAGPDDRPFSTGSRVCFQVRVTFPAGTSTRLPVITDYLPDNLTYEPNSFATVTGVNTAAYTVDHAALNTAFATGTASLRPGVGSGSNRYVEKGQVFAFTLSATVNGNDKTTKDVQGNLAKLRWTDRAGKVSSLRDMADFAVPAVPPVEIDKRVAKAPYAGYADSQNVVEGQVVRYSVNVANRGTMPVSNVQVWDKLPLPFTCADVSNITAGTCIDSVPAGGQSTIKSTLVTALGPDFTGGFTYDVTIPVGTSVGTTYTNTAYVRSYQTPTNLGGVSDTHFPANNIDPLVPADQQTAPEATDTANVVLPTVGLSKSNVTAVTETNNSATQAVPGEAVTYTIRATIPAHTTVYNGTLTDPVPTGITLVSAAGTYSATGATPATAPLPAGVTISPIGALTLPATWTNDTDDPQVFEIRLVAKVTPAHTGTTALTNTATFASTTTGSGSTPVRPVTASSQVTPVHPSPTLTKALSTPPVQNATPSIGESREFVLTASNATGRPHLYDTVIIDCVPAGLVVTALGTGATQLPAAPGDACATVAGTGTTITWNAGTVATGSPKTLRYSVQVGAGAAGGQAYVNTARLTGSSLQDGGNVTANEEVLTRTATSTLTVPSASITKTIADNTLIVGELATYTVRATLPAHVNFYDLRVTDGLPAGLDPTTLSTTSVVCTEVVDGDCAVSSTPLDRSGQTVGWFLGDVVESTRTRIVTIRFTAKVAPSVLTNTIGVTRDNIARVGWNRTNRTNPTSVTSTSDAGTSSAAVRYTIQEPRTAITKVVSDTTPAPGATFTYTVRASNPGGTNVTDAHNVVVEDVVPAGVVVDEESISGGGTYDATNRTITWNIDVLTVAAPSFKELTYQAKLAATGTLDGTGRVNTAAVTGFTSLPVVADGRTYVGSSATATVTPDFPHTVVAKEVVGSPVSYVGEPQNFRITVTSDGRSPAYDIDVTDVLPKNWTFDTASATVKVGSADAVFVPPTTDDAGNPQTVAWTDLAPSGLPVGQTIVINYTATPGAGATTDAGAGSQIDHTNTVSILAEDQTGATGIPGAPFYAGPDEASAQIHEADLEITKSGDGTPVAGTTYSWDIVVENLGGDTSANDIVVTDTIPEHVSSFSLDGGDDWVCTSDEDAWTCTLDADLAAGATAPGLTASGLIDSDLSDGTPIVNTATVEGHTFDPEDDNNTDTETVEVTVEADLAIDKRLGGTVVTAGENATWTLDVTNLGPSTSRAPITVTDTLPAGATFESATGTGWDCEAEGREITCERDSDLVVGPAPQITVVATISAAQTAAVVNTAEVSGTTPEPDTETAEENNTDSVSTTPTRTTDLTIEKSLAGDDPAVAGSNAIYDMEVRNVGPSTATSVRTVDTLPSYMTFVGASGTGWTCSAASQVVTCTLAGSMAVNGEASYQLTVDIAAGHTGDIENTVRVTAAEDPTGDEDTDTNTPGIEADLVIEKSHEDDAVAGERFTYDLEVTNRGPSDAVGPIVVEDTVPTGMTFVTGGNDDWACELDEGVVICTTTGGLLDGANSSFSLTFDVASTAGPATVSNVATVDGSETDPDPDNNGDVDPTPIVDEANVSISKVAQSDSVHAGADVTWRITVRNDGPSTADSISVTDVLPAGLTVVSATGDGWDCDETITCTRPTLAPDASASFDVVTTVGSGVAADTEITNSATVTTTTPGDDPDDNSDDDSVEVTTSANLSLDKTHDGTPIAGMPFTFTLTATNQGPSDALSPITIVDELPVGMTYLSANDAWACLPGAVSNAGQEVVCTLNGTAPVLPGQSAPVLTMSVGIAADQADEELVNTAVVTSPTPDPVSENNSSTDTVTPTDEVDLAITKSHTGPVEIGQQLEFTLRVSNAGPSEARDVVVEDLLPAGLIFERAQGEGWTCAEDESACALDEPLAPGSVAEPITVTVTVTPEAYPGVDNVATVETRSNDRDDSNDTATDAVVVPPQVNLSVVKELTGTLRVGQQGVYTLTVTNDGPTLDPGQVTVTDDLPAGLTFVSGEAEGWACGADGQLVTCERDGDLAVDASDTITLTVDVDAAAYPSVVNTAMVSTESPDTDPSDDESTIESPVDGSAVLAIDKSLVRQDGDEAVWSIKVTNEGPTETTGRVTVTDKLPTSLKFVSAKGEGWTCSASGQVISCDRELPLAVGDTAEIEVVTTITVDDGSEIVNVASVEGGNAVPDDDSAVSDDAVVTAPEAEDESTNGPDSLIPDTGGPAFWLLLLGLLGVFGGAAITVRNRGRQVHEHQ